MFGQAQRAQRERACAVAGPARDPHQLEAPAAEVGDDPVRVGEGADHAVGAEQRFLFARNHPRIEPDRAQLCDEFRAVGGIAHRCGGDGLDILDAHVGEQQRETPQPPQRQRHRLVGEPAGRGNLAPELGGDLLVQQHRGRAHRAAIDDKAHRVRTDIDDRALRPCAADRARAVCPPPAPDHATAPLRSDSLGTAPASSAPPRPESEGLVMK